MPKLLFEIANSSPALDEVRTIVVEFAEKRSYSLEDGSEKLPSGDKIFFTVTTPSGVSIRAFNGKEGASLFVGVFSSDRADWTRVACEAHQVFGSQWPRVSIVGGEITAERLLTKCGSVPEN